MRFILTPTLAQENGRTATYTSLDSGGQGDGYWSFGTGARFSFTTSATRARVRCYATQSPFPFSQTNPSPSLLGYRVNGVEYWSGLVALGDDWYEMILPAGLSKRFELFVPPQGIVVLNQSVLGIYPVEIEFNGATTAVAATTGGNHRVIVSDSIGTGMNAAVASLQGFGGIMKRGISDAYHASYQGTYSAGTLYSVGQIVKYNGSTWKKLTTAAAGTTPTVGSDWQIRGYDGRVTLVAHGYRRLYDDAATGGAATTFAATIAALSPTEIIFLIGTNDWVAGWSAASFQTGYTNVLNALAGTSASAVPVRCVSPLLTTTRETNNGYGDDMDDYRTAVSSAVAATSKSSVTYVDGKVILASGDLYDGLHPTYLGHQKLREALL